MLHELYSYDTIKLKNEQNIELNRINLYLGFKYPLCRQILYNKRIKLNKTIRGKPKEIR